MEVLTSALKAFSRSNSRSNSFTVLVVGDKRSYALFQPDRDRFLHVDGYDYKICIQHTSFVDSTSPNYDGYVYVFDLEKIRDVRYFRSYRLKLASLRSKLRSRNDVMPPLCYVVLDRGKSGGKYADKAKELANRDGAHFACVNSEQDTAIPLECLLDDILYEDGSLVQKVKGSRMFRDLSRRSPSDQKLTQTRTGSFRNVTGWDEFLPLSRKQTRLNVKDQGQSGFEVAEDGNPSGGSFLPQLDPAYSSIVYQPVSPIPVRAEGLDGLYEDNSNYDSGFQDTSLSCISLQHNDIPQYRNNSGSDGVTDDITTESETIVPSQSTTQTLIDSRNKLAPSRLSAWQSVSSLRSIDDCYDVGVNKGFALIINNMNFDPKTGLKSRDGADFDEENLERIFKKFSLQTCVYVNQTGEEMQEILSAASKMDLRSYAMFVCCILSHGDSGVVFGTDGESVPIYESLCLFKKDSCSTLEGKPKIFIVQACQGKSSLPTRQESITTKMPPLDKYRPKYKSDSSPFATNTVTAIPSEQSAITDRLLPEEDFLICWSSLPGYQSYRSNELGSVFIHELVKSVKRYGFSQPLTTIMNHVTRKVTKLPLLHEKDGQLIKQVPMYSSTLTKNLVLG